MSDFETTLAFLQRLVDDRARLLELPPDERKALLTVVGRLANPSRLERRKVARAGRSRDRESRREEDKARLDQTQIRSLRRAPIFETPAPPLDVQQVDTEAEVEPERTLRARTCYVCKVKYDEIHFHYDSMCPSCADFNWRKREQTADLTGRTALVTGARVKIGYQAGIKMLRAGARLIVTTRFPRDAALRYAREADYEDWADRLVIYGLDLRHTPSVEAVCKRINAEEERLDFILNNACQTVRRPSGFYAHLMEAEQGPLSALPEPAQRLLQAHERHTLARRSPQTLGLDNAPGLSQVALLEEDVGRDLQLFPAGELDADLQQVDLRDHNSWRAEMHEVSAVELLEVHLVNTVAPFILNARLKPLMLRHPSQDKHIVNVSAVEGQFYRRWKTHRHPHTNMAKASMNMMTRTSAADYLRDGIHMNSVDTGWITNENPVGMQAPRRDYEFHPPLDIVDGAARICDPIFHGFNTGEHLWGLFLKDYQVAPW